MPRVVIFGAGKSSPYLIKKIQESSDQLELQITIIDTSFDQLPDDCRQHKNTDYFSTSINEKKAITKIISHQDLVISMLPAHLHIAIAQLCLIHKKNLLTASYVHPKMELLHKEAQKKGLLFLNEMGVDPGLDHMSAMELIQKLKKQGANITGFYSHTGGLIKKTQPDSWNYKFTWNPKNVITAGAEGATYIKDKQITNIPYHRVFTEITPVTINNKKYDSYPNRNSLAYAEKYNLKEIKNLYRGTLRHDGYCNAWNIFVKLGMTEDSQLLSFKTAANRKDFLNYFLPKNQNTEIAFLELFNLTRTHPIFKKFEGLDFFYEEKKLTQTKGTAAKLLLSILSEDWQMRSNDKDSLVMQHQVNYSIDGINYCTKSELSVTGENNHYTAMAKTVGAPMFEAAILMLKNKIKLTGVHIPTKTVIYQPILERLKNHGLEFTETTNKL